MRKAAGLLLGASIVLGRLVGTAHGATWSVERDGSGDFTTIQAAVETASDGDTIHIGPGHYTDQTTVDGTRGCVWLDGTKSLVFLGSGAEQTSIGPEVYAGWHQDLGFSCPEGDVAIRFENLKVVNLDYIGLSMFNREVVLINCVVEHCNRGVSTGEGNETLTIRNCRFINGPDGESGSIAIRCRGLVSELVGIEVDNYARGVQVGYYQFPVSFVSVSDCSFHGGELGLEGIAFYTRGGGSVTNCRFRGWDQAGLSVQDAGGVVFDDNIIDASSGIGASLNVCEHLAMRGNVISGQGTACIDIVGAAGLADIHGNHFLRDGATGGFFVTTVVPGGPFQVDLGGNYWGTTDPDEIALWIADADDSAEVGLFVDYLPIADGPVATESVSWTDVKRLFR